LAVHPGESLEACFAERCQEVRAEQAVVQLTQGNTDLGRPELLTVSMTGADPRQLVNERVALNQVIEPSACGNVDYWGLNARIAADGRLDILGWSGYNFRAARTVPVPSVTRSNIR
jgi:hypothetical protein